MNWSTLALVRATSWLVAIAAAVHLGCAAESAAPPRAKAPAPAAPSRARAASSAPSRYSVAMRLLPGRGRTTVRALRVYEGCKPGIPVCRPVRGALVYARRFDCAGRGACAATNALDRMSYTDGDGEIFVDEGTAGARPVWELWLAAGESRAFAGPDGVIVDDTREGLVRAGEIASDAPAGADPATIEAARRALAAEEAEWKAAAARCRDALLLKSCDAVQAYVEEHPSTQHRAEAEALVRAAAEKVARQEEADRRRAEEAARAESMARWDRCFDDCLGGDAARAKECRARCNAARAERDRKRDE